MVPIAPSPSIPAAGCRGKGLLTIPKADCGFVLASKGITLPSKAAGKGKAIVAAPARADLAIHAPASPLLAASTSPEAVTTTKSLVMKGARKTSTNSGSGIRATTKHGDAPPA